MNVIILYQVKKIETRQFIFLTWLKICLESLTRFEYFPYTLPELLHRRGKIRELSNCGNY